MRAFFLWYEDVMEPVEWSNPIRKEKAPKVPMEPFEPESFETLAKMVKACPDNTFNGDRDAAILLCLLDTGARANELFSVNLDDINQTRGAFSFGMRRVVTPVLCISVSNQKGH